MEGEDQQIPWELAPLPRDQDEALEWLLALIAAADGGRLRQVPPDEFRKGWIAIAFLYPGLHPDSVWANGTLLMHAAQDAGVIETTEPRLVSPSFAESGWPVVLMPIAEE